MRNTKYIIKGTENTANGEKHATPTYYPYLVKSAAVSFVLKDYDKAYEKSVEAINELSKYSSDTKLQCTVNHMASMLSNFYDKDELEDYLSTAMLYNNLSDFDDKIAKNFNSELKYHYIEGNLHNGRRCLNHMHYDIYTLNDNKGIDVLEEIISDMLGICVSYSEIVFDKSNQCK